MTKNRWVRSIMSYSSLAIALTSLSVIYERSTSEPSSADTACAAVSETCDAHSLAAGFPFSFVYADPSASASLPAGDGDFRALPFASNVVLWLAALVLMQRMLDARRARLATPTVSSRRPSLSRAPRAGEMSRPGR